MKYTFLRSFAAGILLATTVCGTVYFSNNSDEKPKTPVQTTEKEPAAPRSLSDEEMKVQLESSGYVVQTKDEYDKKIEETKNAVQKEQPAEESKDVNQVIFFVTEGMTSIDVGKILVEAKITDNANKFSQRVEKKGVQNRLRPGVYKVDSKMSVDEIISSVFK